MLLSTSNANCESQRRITVYGAEFDESFIAELLSQHFRSKPTELRPTITTAFEIYMRENLKSRRRKFAYTATVYFRYFFELFGDVALDDLRHWHITQYRDHQLARGLQPSCDTALAGEIDKGDTGAVMQTSIRPQTPDRTRSA